MKIANYKEKARLILIDNKLSRNERITAINDVIDEMVAEFEALHAELVGSHQRK